MNRLLASFALVAAPLIPSGTLAAQAATPPVNVRLDGIVAIVNDQPITRFDLRDAVLAKITRKEAEEPKDSVAMLRLEWETLNDMIQDELLIQSAKDLKITV